MEPLPYIDEHSQRLDAPADVVWTALLKVLRREMGGSTPMARLLSPRLYSRNAGRVSLIPGV